MLTLILGGARSGKSRYAQSLCAGDEPIFYLATARVDLTDEEMVARIARHRDDRPRHWRAIEEPLEITERIKSKVPAGGKVLVDCVTIWLSNFMWEERDAARDAREQSVLRKVEDFAAIARDRDVVAVSNEVGGGVVPDNPVGRAFRDLQGSVNQLLARKADQVVLVIAGLPLTLKG